MKRTQRFAEPAGLVTCTTENGERLDVPVFVGILKHPTADQLVELLVDPQVLRKYTCEALRRASWPVLRRFPRRWLVACLSAADLPSGRRRALEFLLDR